MKRDRERPATVERPPKADPAPPPHSPAMTLLALQRSHGNQAVGRYVRTLRTAPSAVLQRKIVITPTAYASGVGVNGGPVNLNAAQMREYWAMAVKDDLEYAQAYADDQESAGLDADVNAIKTAATKAAWVGAVEQLIQRVNAVHTRANLKPNSETRYATDSKDPGYAHSREQVHWGDDPTMWDRFGTGLAATQGLNTVAPRGGNPRLPLKVLPWADAQRLLPRPLLNLIFDVRLQLEAPGANLNQPVIDERTATQKQNRNTTPNDPGTLRSWHEDSKRVLPANNMGAQPPAHATALHNHYAATSQSGSGAAIVGGAGPIGYAEYTGTGSNSEHSTKVVLDYVQKRVYLTLTHYQYWAMLELEAGGFQMWPTGTQEQVDAEGRLQDRLRDAEQPKVKNATMMSPWMEVLTA